MEDGNVDSLGAKPRSVSTVSCRKAPRNKHEKPRKRDWKKWAPVVMIAAVVVIIGTRHGTAPAAGAGVHVSLSQLSGNASVSGTQGNAPASGAGSAPRRQQASGVSAITRSVSPDSGQVRQFTPPPVTSPFTSPARGPAPSLSPAAAPAVTPAAPAAASSPPAAKTAAAAVIKITSAALGAVRAAAAIAGI